MKIAVPYENGLIFGHFGHTEAFKIYETDGEKILSQKILSSNGEGHGALAGLLRNEKIDVLICGGIGGGAVMALEAAGIDLYPGIQGTCDAAVEALLAGTLPKNVGANCSHHHGGEGHSCGDHPCGTHTCGGSCH